MLLLALGGGHLPLFATLRNLLTQILHLVLSHHGELEYGSPKVPMTVEAIALHHLENLDAKINSFSMALASDLQAGQDWTSFNRMFGRRLFKTRMP